MSTICNAPFSGRICDLQYEPHCWLLPIEGYEKLPNVSLENAIDSLQHIVTDIRRKAYIAKQICVNPADGLSPDESAAIMLYTMEWEPREKCLYFLLNNSLREKSRAVLKPWLPYLKLLLNGLNKLPSKPCRVFRGVKMAFHQNYRTGSIVIWWGFSSCTKSLDALQSEAVLGKNGTRTLFSIECYSGKDIQKHSYFGQEQEVILLPARQFKVTGVLDQGNGMYTVQIEEIDPEVPLLGSTDFTNLPQRPSTSQRRERGIIFFNYENKQLQDKIDHYAESKNINLTFQKLTDQDMGIVATDAIARKACKRLDLSENEITSAGFSILAKALRNNTTLESLSVAANRLSDDAVATLIDPLTESRLILTELGLGINKITDVGAEYLAEILKVNRTLISLGLNKNEIGDRGAQALLKVLTSTNRSLRMLNLSFNKSITDASVEFCVNMLNENTTMEELYLLKCDFSVAGIKKIKQAAENRPNMKLYV